MFGDPVVSSGLLEPRPKDLRNVREARVTLKNGSAIEPMFLPAGILLSVCSMPSGVSEFVYESGVGISRRGSDVLDSLGSAGAAPPTLRTTVLRREEQDGVPTTIQDVCYSLPLLPP